LYALLLVLLGFGVLYPVLTLLGAPFSRGLEVATGVFGALLRSRYYHGVLRNTVVLASVVGAITTIVAFAAAYATSRFQIKGMRILENIFLLPTITPPFFFAMSFILLFGRRGLVTYGLLDQQTGAIYGLPGLALAQTVAFFPFAYLLLRGLLLRLDASVEEAAVTMGARPTHVLRDVILPLLLPGIGSAFLLVFLDSLGDLGAPLLLSGRYSVLSSEIYLAIIGRFDIPEGAALAILLVVPAIGLFVIQRGYLDRRALASVGGRAVQRPVTLGSPGWHLAGTVLVWSIAGFIVVLYLSIGLASVTRLWGVDFSVTWNHYQSVFKDGLMILRATLILAGIAALLSAVLSTVTGYLVGHLRITGGWLLEALSTLPLAIPGTVVGLALAVAFGRDPVILTGTAALIVIGLVARTLSYGTRFAVVALRQLDRSLTEASAVMGATDWQTFRGLLLPLLRPAIISSLIFNFTRNVVTFSAIIFLVSPRWNLMTPAIIAAADSGRLGDAAALSVLLIAAVLCVVGPTASLVRYRGGFV